MRFPNLFMVLLFKEICNFCLKKASLDLLLRALAEILGHSTKLVKNQNNLVCLGEIFEFPTRSMNVLALCLLAVLAVSGKVKPYLI